MNINRRIVLGLCAIHTGIHLTIVIATPSVIATDWNRTSQSSISDDLLDPTETVMMVMISKISKLFQNFSEPKMR